MSKTECPTMLCKQQAEAARLDAVHAKKRESLEGQGYAG